MLSGAKYAIITSIMADKKLEKKKWEKSPRQKAKLKKRFAEKAKKAAAGVFDNEPLVSDNKASILILQWLTYAFWGWTLLAFVWLLYIVLASLINGDNVTGMIPFAIAASVVLLPISFACDWFYSKHESDKKRGAEMLIMVVHAVIFALFGIGMLVSALIVTLQLMITTPADFTSQIVWLVTFIVSALFYAMTFLRTLNPKPKLKIQHKYSLVMAVTISVLIVLGFFGPVAQASQTRNDRDVAAYLDDVANSINSYVYEKQALPDNLGQVKLDGIAADIVSRDLVAYHKEDSSDESRALEPSDNEFTESLYTYYRYRLCVTYTSEDTENRGYSPEKYEGEYFSNYPTTYGHPAGDVCYKIETNTAKPKE